MGRIASMNAPAGVTPEMLAFDAACKRYVASGKEPAEAVDLAIAETGVVLHEKVKEALVSVLTMALRASRDPDHVRKRNALERRIRHLVKGEGLSIAKAVRQAQEDTGVKLTEQGTEMLIQVLEEESEKMSALGIETVSDEEYEKLTGQKVKPS
jgi:hypothetical protein